MENSNYYFILALGYGSSLLAYWIVLKKLGSRLENNQYDDISRPWIQVGIIFLCIIPTLVIGRLFVNGYLVPGFKLGALNVSQSINQILIYSPFPIFLLISKQSFGSAWLPRKAFWTRLGIGFLLSILSTLIFVLVSQKKEFFSVVQQVYHIQNTHHLVQVFLEDFAIALLLSRFSAAIGSRYFVWVLVFVGIIFSAGHLPNNLNNGLDVVNAIGNILMDTGLVVGVGLMMQKSKDFLWLWPIHFAMDMMQFYSGLTYN